MTRRLIEGEDFLFQILRAHYKTEEKNTALASAVLESCYFIDPAVVATTQCLPIVRSRRVKEGEKKNSLVNGDFVSDNFPPDYIFRAAMADERHSGSTWLCHIYSKDGESGSSFFYTNLANLCLMPAFLAKFADTNGFIVDLLKRCSYELYGFNPYARDFGKTVSELKDKIQIARRRDEPIGQYLNRMKEKRFLQAKAAGFLFDVEGNINEVSSWVQEMKGRMACGGASVRRAS